jgi:hypothetical protein
VIAIGNDSGRVVVKTWDRTGTDVGREAQGKRFWSARCDAEQIDLSLLCTTVTVSVKENEGMVGQVFGRQCLEKIAAQIG